MTNDSICIVYHTNVLELYWTRLCLMQPEIGPIYTFTFHLINFSFDASIVRVSFIIFSFSFLSLCSSFYTLNYFAFWNPFYFVTQKIRSTLSSSSLPNEVMQSIIRKFSTRHTKWMCRIHVSNGGAFHFFCTDNKADLIECISLAIFSLPSMLIFHCLKFPAYAGNILDLFNSKLCIDSFSMPSIKITQCYFYRLFVRSFVLHKWKMQKEIVLHPELLLLLLFSLQTISHVIGYEQWWIFTLKQEEMINERKKIRHASPKRFRFHVIQYTQ